MDLLCNLKKFEFTIMSFS